MSTWLLQFWNAQGVGYRKELFEATRAEAFARHKSEVAAKNPSITVTLHPLGDAVRSARGTLQQRVEA